MTQHNEANNATLAAIRARLAAVTPGPWSEKRANDYSYAAVYFITNADGKFVISLEPIEFKSDVLSCPTDEDADLIAHAPTDLRYQQDLIERLNNELRVIEWAADDYDNGEARAMCPDCQNWRHDGHRPNCTLAALLKETE